MYPLNKIYHFRKSYFVFSLSLLIAEILISVYTHDDFIRPILGDHLVVILIYCLIRMVFIIPIPIVAISVLIFSYLIETLEYFKLADRLGLLRGSLVRTLLGVL